MWYSAIRCLVTFILSLLVAPLAAHAQPGENTAHWRLAPALTDRGWKFFRQGLA
jgi:hypothetical protein